MVLSMERWKGKVAIVTGASAGIGAATVEKLLEAGMNVVGMARRKELIEQQASKLKHLPGTLVALKVDISKEEEIIAAFKWVVENVGPVHVLINNAGMMKQSSIIDGDSDIWRDTFDVNVIGVCVATREAVRNMRKNNIDGHIIHISSIAAHVTNGLFTTNNVYGASKHALRAAADMMRLELEGSNLNIKVGCISPGPVDTDLVTEFRKEHKTVDKVFNKAVQPSDIADAVVFSLSTPANVQIEDMIINPVF